jgi:glycolate oxidase iron-sulfur subunit
MAPHPALTEPVFRQKLDQCIHCGLCLPACPTYNELHLEMDSPRGRINLMKAAADGRIDTGGAFAEHIDLCLGCRACETACPSGVQYGSLLETARAVIAEEQPAPPPIQLVQWAGLRQLMPHRERLRLLARLAWLYQKSGIQRIVRRFPALPGPLRAAEAILPPMDLAWPNRGDAPAIGPERGVVAFFTGCVQDAFLAPINRATIRVLQRNGYTVRTPQLQSCCGAAAAHTGDRALACALARRNIDAFAQAFPDKPPIAIVNNAGGCGTALGAAAHWLSDDPAYAERAAAFAGQVQDINQFLARHLHVPPDRPLPARVAYVDSCHLRHGQKVSREPRQLLRSIPGLELVELAFPDQCCGSAGVYNLTHPAMAEAVLAKKMEELRASGVTVIATANTGCHMQILAGVRQTGLQARVCHVVELLDQAYAGGA